MAHPHCKRVHIYTYPVIIAGILFSLQGFPCKTLYFPVRDCIVLGLKIYMQKCMIATLLICQFCKQLSTVTVMRWSNLFLHQKIEIKEIFRSKVFPGAIDSLVLICHDYFLQHPLKDNMNKLMYNYITGHHFLWYGSAYLYILVLQKNH